MADYKGYLAASILTEGKVVTYRLLSRALKVHVNAAKEMLFEFHKNQNAKKPGTIHATYLISGTKRKEGSRTNKGVHKDGEDDYMQSSPFVGSSMPQPEGQGETEEISLLSITLTREEDLGKLQTEYEQITSIHIYSLEPHPLIDLQILSDITREMKTLISTEDTLESLSQYGTITSKDVKCRARRRPPPADAASASTQSKSQPKLKPATTQPVPKKEEPKFQQSSAKDFFGKGKEKTKAAATSNPPSKDSMSNPPNIKRENSSIFKSFAKAKPKKKQDTEDGSAAASPTAEDQSMKDVDDDDEIETYVPPPSKEVSEGDRKSRKEREAALKKMMEDSDEEEVATPKSKDVEVEEDEPEVKEKSVEKEEPSVISGGRRRGRRRVMKKKTVTDAEGYLVTKEEQAWESFSEDEPIAMPKPKPKPQAITTTTKTKKGAAKAGQGSIMSFFGKK